MSWGIFTPGQRKSLGSNPSSREYLYTFFLIVCRNTRRSWGFYSLLSAWLGCCWAAGSICLCSLLLCGPSGAVVAQAAAATTQVWQVCSLQSVFQLLGSSTKANSLLLPPQGRCCPECYRVELCSGWDALLCPVFPTAADAPPVYGQWVSQAVLRINQAPNRRALEY